MMGMGVLLLDVAHTKEMGWPSSLLFIRILGGLSSSAICLEYGWGMIFQTPVSLIAGIAALTSPDPGSPSRSEQFGLLLLGRQGEVQR